MNLFDNLSNDDIQKICGKIVEKSAIDEEYNTQKLAAVKKAMELNETLRENRNRKKQCASNEGLIGIYDAAIKQKIHPYELLKENGFIKDPFEEFLKVN